jgi:hypothetical protein
MKLLIINNNLVTHYYFNQQDAQTILSRCQAAGKQWSNNLVGFTLTSTNQTTFAAINIIGNDGVVESMEYVDIDTGKPEFTINNDLLIKLSKNESQTEISLTEFESILTEILTAPVKARRWEVYPEVNHRYQPVH